MWLLGFPREAVDQRLREHLVNDTPAFREYTLDGFRGRVPENHPIRSNPKTVIFLQWSFERFHIALVARQATERTAEAAPRFGRLAAHEFDDLC
jgi:hypothetical protein